MPQGRSIKLDEPQLHVPVLGANVPVYGLRILAAHIAVGTLETRQIDAFEPVMAAHAAGSVKGAGAPGARKAPPVQGRL